MCFQGVFSGALFKIIKHNTVFNHTLFPIRMELLNLTDFIFFFGLLGQCRYEG